MADLLQMFCKKISHPNSPCLALAVWHLDKDKQGALRLFITDEQLTKRQLLHNFS